MLHERRPSRGTTCAARKNEDDDDDDDDDDECFSAQKILPTSQDKLMLVNDSLQQACLVHLLPIFMTTHYGQYSPPDICKKGQSLNGTKK
ncbi:Protein of unknown function [Gryllus bimaculatus]|nr:Protein of unknown function [Gryllus bimaculatus]